MLARMLTAAALVAALGPAAGAQAREPIMPLADVQRGMRCSARTVVQGATITSFDVDVLDVVADIGGSGPRILVRVSGDAVAGSGIAQGFSGSPVYCATAGGELANAGAISATIGQFGNDVGLVTPIEQMLGLPVRPPDGVRRASAKLARSVRPIATPLTISGLDPSLGRLVERVARRGGRALVAAPAGPLATFPPQPLVPGASMAVGLATGAIAASAIGTLTYRDGDVVYGFGHAFDSAGRRSLLLQDAYVYTVVDNPFDGPQLTSYKLAAPGHAHGTVTNDAPAGVVATVGAQPQMFPLRVRVRDPQMRRTLRQRTSIVDEVDVGDPSGQGATATIASLAVAQATTTAFDGAPARESGSLCLSARVRGAGKPMRFCNRYVLQGVAEAGAPAPLGLTAAEDVSRALDAIASARFARLRVEQVRADLTIARGLQLATMRSLRGPRTVQRGQVVPLKLKVRIAQGPLRTLRVPLRIPRDAPLGARTLRLVGSPLDSSGGGDELEIVFDVFGSDDGGSGGAQTMREVRDAFEGTRRYDGVRARLGAARWRAYRNENLRIDGSASLDVRVVRAGRR